MKPARTTMMVLAIGSIGGCGMFMENPAPPAPPPVPAETRLAAAPHCDEPSHLPRPPIPDHPPTEGAPEAVTQVPPEYPEIARKANVDGTVVAWVLVCEHGNVVNIQIDKSVAMLDAAAVTAMSQWKFRPGLQGGKPVPMWIRLPMKFTLN